MSTLMETRDVMCELASLYGIAPDYADVFGRSHETPDETRYNLLKAMGVRVDDPAAIQAEIAAFGNRSWLRALEPVMVVRESDAPPSVQITLPQSRFGEAFQWTLEAEDGQTQSGELPLSQLEVVDRRDIDGQHYQRVWFQLPAPLSRGYYRFRLNGTAGNGQTAPSLKLVIAPHRCYWLEQNPDQKIWGPAVQLYSLRSRRNWGMGDFTDLKNLVDWCADQKAGMIGLNPLHPLFPNNPDSASPYSPSSRKFLNIFYIDVEAVEDFREFKEAQAKVASSEFQAKLAALRETELVDYIGVAEVKMPLLEMLYQSFRRLHLDQDTERARAFREFQKKEGAALHGFALYEALREHFHRRDAANWGWPVWPETYREPGGSAVAEFEREHIDRVEFYQYLQWQAELQFKQVQKHALEKGMPIGLYLDLAVGVNPGGSETWAERDTYAQDVSVGCPPDLFNMQGQNWGLPPLKPNHLYETGYEAFIETLRYNMRHAGALRLDHFMGLMRLFWISNHQSAVEGAYVAYPFEDLLGILALESHRNRCVIVGEDLGTVPPIVRERMDAWGVFSYKVFLFEKRHDGAFKFPGEFPTEALVTFSTHDLPTMTGYLSGKDIEVREGLGLFPTPDTARQQRDERLGDLWQMLQSLEREGLVQPGSVQSLHGEALTSELRAAFYAYLGKTPSKLAAFQFEDILAQPDQVNLPGTVDQYPNWRRKLTLNVEDLATHEGLNVLGRAMRGVRG